MKDKTLLILAAGMGSRFGGLKQIEPMGPNGEFLIDYSIYDALKAGFTKVVFVIKKENYEVFKSTIGKRVEDKIPVEYAFQELSDIPSHLKFPEDRTKPLGTSHAILAARHVIHEPFVTINADDFYGNMAKVKKDGKFGKDDYCSYYARRCGIYFFSYEDRKGSCICNGDYPVLCIVYSILPRIYGRNFYRGNFCGKSKRYTEFY